jgi:phage terminase large subunit-like protein
MVKHSEVFVGIDVAKLKNAIAIAEFGRDGEEWHVRQGVSIFLFRRPFRTSAKSAGCSRTVVP